MAIIRSKGYAHFKIYFISLVFRERGREGLRGRETSMARETPITRARTGHETSALWDNPQPTKPRLSGQGGYAHFYGSRHVVSIA